MIDDNSWSHCTFHYHHCIEECLRKMSPYIFANPRLPRMLYPYFITQSSLQGQAIRSNSSIVPHNKWQFTQNAQRWSKLLWSFTKKNEALQIFPFVTLMKQYLECFSWFNYAQFLERPLHSNSQLTQAENARVTFIPSKFAETWS